MNAIVFHLSLRAPISLMMRAENREKRRVVRREVPPCPRRTPPMCRPKAGSISMTTGSRIQSRSQLHQSVCVCVCVCVCIRVLAYTDFILPCAHVLWEFSHLSFRHIVHTHPRPPEAPKPRTDVNNRWTHDLYVESEQCPRERGKVRGGWILIYT